ncbi:Formyltransferase [Ascodesmis nigricans]|uniref:methionyl-tRNA formyltransferase n=1 Tax=Ascodesmis nigricans TaxID=341454 RepID=A0A4S2N845_9PEZI|nr:Formyltransferase [Ascodesmis nigricans]
MLLLCRPRLPSTPLWRLARAQCSRYSTVQREPLSILFAGSDDFSIVSLRALREEQERNPDLIKSLSVLCRTPGKVGRKLDIIKDVPIAAVAESLELPIHRISGFDSDATTLPDPSTNLLIAVSFGLKIPAGIINALPHGGLNVHPSLLPTYRGAAPIHRIFLDQARETGVSIQTLHPTRIDHGEILKQTSPPIKVTKSTSYPALREQLAEEGARLLVETLREGLYASELAQPGRGLKTGYPSCLAKKVTKDDMRVDWGSWEQWMMKQRAEMFGSLWTTLEDVGKNKPGKRIILDNIECIPSKHGALTEAQKLFSDLEPGQFRFWKRQILGGGQGKPDLWMLVKCKDGFVRIGGVQLDGKKRVDAGEWAQGLKCRGAGKTLV